MSKDSNNWRDELWGRHTNLFVGTAPFASGIWSLPDGWQETIEQALDRIAVIVDADQIGQMTITRLLRAQAVLGFEWTSASLRLEPMVAAEVDRVSARAACTCEVCGAAGRRFIGLSNITVRCDTHRVRGSTELMPPWPLIRIDREIEAGMSRIVICRIYDRDRDEFIDIPPSDLGIPDTP